MTDFIDIVFDGPPGPESGRFVEVEDPDGRSINVGTWIDRGDGLWALRIEPAAVARPDRLIGARNALAATVRDAVALDPAADPNALAAVAVLALDREQPAVYSAAASLPDPTFCTTHAHAWWRDEAACICGEATRTGSLAGWKVAGRADIQRERLPMVDDEEPTIVIEADLAGGEG